MSSFKLLTVTTLVHEAKYVFPIPDGLKELSSDIIREVLRHQPEHINGFVADYLETMLSVRENARESGIIICDAFREGYFFDELFKTKNINREQANFYATTIQANWRGYVVRRKICEWLKKKKKFEEEQERKRSLKIEELLAGLGITYDEAKRAAGVIQAAYKESKRGKWIPGESGEYWIEEVIPLGQRIREGDRALGRFDRWEQEDFGDFFEMDEAGAIKYVWPRVGQLRKVLREEVPKRVPIVEFFAMRDLNGQEQYSYLIKSQPETEIRGCPIGFLMPMPKSCVIESTQKVDFTDPEKTKKMGSYIYLFRDDLDRTELKKLDELLKTQAKAQVKSEVAEELDYDPNWVLPKVLVRIKKDLLLPTDDEVKFLSLPDNVICEQDHYTFRAETLEQTSKIIRHILRNQCLSVEEGMLEAANMSPYKFQETGRIFPVEKFTQPSFIQKIHIAPESTTAEEESLDFMRYNYVFFPPEMSDKSARKGESLFSISIIRFQGYHSDYKGSEGLDNKVFIMGPRITTPNGKPFTYESLFWDEFGIEAWYQLLFNYDDLQEILGEEEEFLGEEMEGEYLKDEESKLLDEPQKRQDTERTSIRSGITESRPDSSEVSAHDTEKVYAPTVPPSEVMVEAEAEAEGEAKRAQIPRKTESEKGVDAEPEPENETKGAEEIKPEDT